MSHSVFIVLDGGNDPTILSVFPSLDEAAAFGDSRFIYTPVAVIQIEEWGFGGRARIRSWYKAQTDQKEWKIG
jgi:hypothetical protein